MHRHFGWDHPRRSRHGFSGHGMGGPGAGRGRHGRGPRIGRFLEHGDLRFVLLALIGETPAHGYELIRALEERTGGAYRPSPGAVYPTLALLEDEGFVRATAAAAGRKAYEITDEGRAALTKQQASVDAIFARLDAVGADDAGRSKVRRAMENVKMALKLRLSRGSDQGEAEKIAAILDEAASRIENL